MQSRVNSCGAQLGTNIAQKVLDQLREEHILVEQCGGKN